MTDSSPQTKSVTWEECLGSATWLCDALQDTLTYPEPLPVQQAVIPTIARAFLSGVPNDVSLTAPTGSGKTLCYLIPLLRLITSLKKGVDHTALRGLILVPTAALGQQVVRELNKLTKHTTITVANCCVEASTPSKEAVVHKTEAAALVREVLVLSPSSSSSPSLSTPSKMYYSRVDIVVATPQRLLHHLDHTVGLSLRHLRLLIIDEADQVLAGNFASYVAKVVECYEAEVAAEQRRLASLSGGGSSSASVHGKGAAASLPPVLYKILCSATLSSRIARISQVRLRNCSYFVLDGNGAAVADANREGRAVAAASSGAAKPTSGVVRATFALPPTLQEHVVFVEDSYRHAALLKLVTLLMTRIKDEVAAQRRDRQKQLSAAMDASPDENDDGQEEEEAVKPREKQEDEPAYPGPQTDGAGSGILVFCATAEEARVMGHFLAAAGVQPVVEFTTLSSESERRHALLQRRPDGVSCVVASDALMRGVDMPYVGHVIMYHPPDAVSQYVHRAGRTARAMRPGHVHVLLSKKGPSGELEDGEVAKYKELGMAVTRTLPVRYERQFFRFARDPKASPAQDTAEDENSPSTEAEQGENPTSATAEWWVQRANQFLMASQSQLQQRWESVLELASKAMAAEAASAAPSGAARSVGSSPPPTVASSSPVPPRAAQGRGHGAFDGAASHGRKRRRA